jgi:ComF family protein
VSVQILLQKSSQFLLDLVFPPRCVNCQVANSWLCEKCQREITFIDGIVCERCGTPTPVAEAASCPQCRHNPLQFIDGIRSAAYFENNPIRPAIHFLKYRNHKAIAAILGQILADACEKYGVEADVVVPVPLHAARFRERGYNQCELLAREVGILLDLPVNINSLQRIRHTKSQMKLGATERHQNVIDAFACRNQALSGQTILLIDDVCTTGSTLDACARALKQHGVISVWGMTLAKAR